MNNSKQKTKNNFLGFLFNTDIPAGIRIVSIINFAFLIYFLFTFIPLSFFLFISKDSAPDMFFLVLIFHLLVSVILAMSIIPLWYGREWARKFLMIFYILLVVYGFFWAFGDSGIFFIFSSIFIIFGSLSFLYLFSAKAAKEYCGKKVSKNDIIGR